MVGIWCARAAKRGLEIEIGGGVPWGEREKGRMRVSVNEVWTGGHWLDYIGLCGSLKDFGFKPEFSGEPLKALKQKSH